jgi:hypothetical protein
MHTIRSRAAFARGKEHQPPGMRYPAYPDVARFARGVAGAEHDAATRWQAAERAPQLVA